MRLDWGTWLKRAIHFAMKTNVAGSAGPRRTRAEMYSILATWLTLLLVHRVLVLPTCRDV